MSEQELEVEGQVEDPEVEVEETTTEEQPFAISREDWETTQNYLRATAPLLQQVQELVASGQLTPQQGAQALEQAQEQAPEYDPFEPESVSRYIDHKVGALIKQALQEQFEPFQGLLGMVASEKGEALARAELESIQGEIGEFDHDLTYVIASPIIEGGGDPSQTFRQVAGYLKARDDQVAQQAIERFKKEHNEGLERIAGASGELSGGATGTEMDKVPTGPHRYREVVERGLAARRAIRPVG